MRKILIFILLPLFLSACSLKDDPSDNGATTTDRLFLGNINAPVLIEEFSDLQCPACAHISPQVEEIVRDNPDVAKLYYYHFPLPQHEYAFIAAEAAECAADQGKFWEYIDLVFKNQSILSKDLLYSMADRLSLDPIKFMGCLDNHEKKTKVVNDSTIARVRRVDATPTLFVNGVKTPFPGREAFEGYIRSLSNQ